MAKKKRGAKPSPISTSPEPTPPDRSTPPPAGGGDGGGPSDRPHRPWALWLLVPLMIFGSWIGVFMTRHHEVELYGSEEEQAGELFGCEESETVSCDIVNTSEWSELFGVPLFTWALPLYLMVLILAVMGARGNHRVKPILVLSGAGAVLFSGFLYYISVVELGKVCLWCMRLYGVNAALLALSLISGVRRTDIPGAKELGIAGLSWLLILGGAVGWQRNFRASLLEGSPEADAASERLAAIEADPSPEAQESFERDPEGPAPALEYTIRTEDGNEAVLRTSPEDAWKGNPNAKVSIIEYADFECGYCKRAGFQLRRLYEAYKDDIVFIYKHFPMHPECNPGVVNPRHRYACQAHAASVCAKDQGYFWAYHDLLYKNNHQLASTHLIAYAEKLGLNMDQWMSCMRNQEGVPAVQAAGQSGKDIDVHGTPRIFIDGTLYRAGASAEQMARAIELALGRSAADAQQAAVAMREDRPDVSPIPDDIPEMQRIRYGDLDFYIDTFEASLQDGRAVSAKGEIPAFRMSWFAASDACEEAGKRMCTEEEWIATCQSARPVDDDGDGMFADDLIEGNAYPYGDFHTAGLCWENMRNYPEHRPVYTGEMPGCVTPTGVYDLTGNIEEWVGATPEEAVLLGGAFDTPDDKARCYRRNDTFGAGYANFRTGFRCCKDAR